VGARAQGRPLPPQALARAVPRRGAGAVRRARAGGRPPRRRVRLGDCARPLPRRGRRGRARRARREARAAPQRRRADVPAALGRHRARRHRRRGAGGDHEPLRRRRAARRLPDGLRGHRSDAVPRGLRRAARPARGRVLDRPRRRLERDHAGRPRRRGRRVRPRPPALGQLPGQRLRRRAPLPRAPPRPRPAARRGPAAGHRRERDGAGGPVQARTRDGRGLGPRPAGVRPLRVLRARVAHAWR
jgi:hypothetical protein